MISAGYAINYCDDLRCIFVLLSSLYKYAMKTWNFLNLLSRYGFILVATVNDVLSSHYIDYAAVLHRVRLRNPRERYIPVQNQL